VLRDTPFFRLFVPLVPPPVHPWHGSDTLSPASQVDASHQRPQPYSRSRRVIANSPKSSVPLKQNEQKGVPEARQANRSPRRIVDTSSNDHKTKHLELIDAGISRVRGSRPNDSADSFRRRLPRSPDREKSTSPRHGKRQTARAELVPSFATSSPRETSPQPLSPVSPRQKLNLATRREAGPMAFMIIAADEISRRSVSPNTPHSAPLAGASYDPRTGLGGRLPRSNSLRASNGKDFEAPAHLVEQNSQPSVSQSPPGTSGFSDCIFVDSGRDGGEGAQRRSPTGRKIRQTHSDGGDGAEQRSPTGRKLRQTHSFSDFQRLPLLSPRGVSFCTGVSCFVPYTHIHTHTHTYTHMHARARARARERAHVRALHTISDHHAARVPRWQDGGTHAISPHPSSGSLSRSIPL